MSSPALLRIAHETTGAAVVVHASGEIDMATAAEFLTHLELACDLARPARSVVADLTAVSFLGSVGLAVLLEVDERCRTQATPLRVVATGPAVLRPLQITGLDQVLWLTNSLDSVSGPT